MEVEINFLGVLLAAVSSMIVGWAWYSKSLFGGRWQKLVKLDEKDMKEGMGKNMGLVFLISLVTAYVLAHVAYLSNSFFQNDFTQDAVMTAFWMWLGFTGARMVTHDLFEQRKSDLTLINISHELVTLLVMGVTIGLVGF